VLSELTYDRPVRDKSLFSIRQFRKEKWRLDADAARVFLAKFARQLQQRLAQALYAVNRNQVGDDLLLKTGSYCHGHRRLHRGSCLQISA